MKYILFIIAMVIGSYCWGQRDISKLLKAAAANRDTICFDGYCCFMDSCWTVDGGTKKKWTDASKAKRSEMVITEMWVCHTILDSPFKQTCLVKIIEATSRDEAELKFDIYIEEQEKILGAKQRDKSAYAVAPLSKGILKEHELKAFQP